MQSVHHGLMKRNYYKLLTVRSSQQESTDSIWMDSQNGTPSDKGVGETTLPECCSDTSTVDCPKITNPDQMIDDIGDDEGSVHVVAVQTPNLEKITRKEDAATHDGYLLAGVAIIASILGRLSSEELRYDASRLFRNQESSRLLNVELRRKRQEWKEQAEVRIALEQRRRVEEVTEKARIEAEKQKKIQEKYEKVAKEEAERRRQEVEASRREYEETQRKLDIEYQERVRKEQIALEEFRRLEQEKRQEEERQRQLELERKEEERRQREQLALEAKRKASEARIQAKKEAEKEMSKFAVRMEGAISINVPPVGTRLPGPLQEEAKVSLCVQASSLLGGQGCRIEKNYASLAECMDETPNLIAEAIQDACEKVVSALQLQKMSSQGPLMLMEKPEVDHWMHVAIIRTSLNGLYKISESVDQLKGHKLEPGTVIVQESFECRTESGVLPPDHPLSYQQMYGQFLDMIVSDPQKRETIEIFEESLAESNEKLYRGISIPVLLRDTPQNLGVCLALAHFIDRCLYTRPPMESDAPAWFETCVAFSRNILNQSFAGAPPDSLGVHSVLVSRALTPSHPISKEIAYIADRNTSEQKKMELKQRENARKAILAAKLLEEEWPDEEELRKARAKEREAKTPVTERIWALKNVASSLAMGGQGEVSRSRQLLEQAVLLKQDMCEVKDHPAVFPEALSLLKVIRSRKEWQNDAAGVGALFLAIVMNISRGYADIGDDLSACAVLELGLYEAEEVAGLRSTITIRGVKYLEACCSKLSQDEIQRLAKSRENRDRVENFLVRALTDELGAYRKDGTNLSKKDMWNSHGAKMLGPIEF